jgi:hypothetical protein
MGEDLTPFPLLMKSSKCILQFGAFLSSEPSTHVGNIQFVVSCLCMMALLRQTSNKLLWIMTICLGLISRRLVAWVTCGVCRMIMRTLCILPLTTKHYGVVNALIF